MERESYEHESAEHLYMDHMIPGTDIHCGIVLEYEPIPIIQDPENPWLPKTDWSRDGIIASDD